MTWLMWLACVAFLAAGVVVGVVCMAFAQVAGRTDRADEQRVVEAYRARRREAVLGLVRNSRAPQDDAVPFGALRCLEPGCSWSATVTGSLDDSLDVLRIHRLQTHPGT